MEFFSEKTKEYIDEIVEKFYFYIFLIVKFVIDGFFILGISFFIVNIHNNWLPSIGLKGLYKDIVNLGAYTLDSTILFPLAIEFFKDIYKFFKDICQLFKKSNK